MDAAKVFVIILTAFAVGILMYLEIKSRGSRSQPETPGGEESAIKKTPSKT
jgi:hypothetical protein